MYGYLQQAQQQNDSTDPVQLREQMKRVEYDNNILRDSLEAAEAQREQEKERAERLEKEAHAESSLMAR